MQVRRIMISGLSGMQAADCVSCRQALRAAAIDKDNASVLVCGGGGVALLVAKQLKDMGAWVWMLQRSQSRKWVT